MSIKTTEVMSAELPTESALRTIRAATEFVPETSLPLRGEARRKKGDGRLLHLQIGGGAGILQRGSPGRDARLYVRQGGLTLRAWK